MNTAHNNNSILNHSTFDSLLNPEVATFILRVALGAVLLAHSVYLKLMIYSLSGTAQYFVSIGLPEFLAYTVFAIEAVAGIALILGFKTRIFSALVIPVLLGAIWAHASNGLIFSNAGGGWEYPLILLIMAFAQMGLGDGKYAIKPLTK